MKRLSILFLSFCFTFLMISGCKQKSEKGSFSSEDQLPKEFKMVYDSINAKHLISLDPNFVIKRLTSLESRYQSDSLVVAYVEMQRGKSYSELIVFDKALEASTNALNYFRNHLFNSRREYISCLTLLASTYVQIGDKQKALSYIKEAEYQSTLIKNVNNKKLYEKSMASLASFTAYVMETTNNDKQGLNYHLKSVNYLLNKNKNDSLTLSAETYNVATVYERLNQLDSADYYLKISKSYIQKSNSIMLMEYDRMMSRLFAKKNNLDSSIFYAEKSFVLLSGKRVLFNNDIATQLALDYDKLGNEKQSEKYYQFAKKTFFSDTILNYVSKEKVITNLLNLAITKKKIKDIDTLNKAFLTVIKNNYNIQKEKALQNAEVLYQVKAKNAQIEKLAIENDLKSAGNREKILILSAIFIIILLCILFFYRQARLKQQRNAIDLEQRLLLAQMNPHFISNALSAIQKEIYEGKTELAISYLNKYAILNRLILENSRKKNIHLEEELKILENYIALQQIRFAKKFDYRFELEKGIEDLEIQIPSMLIQPFIENAIEHGFKNINYKGLLIIKIYVADYCLMCDIIDNGSGISISQAAKTKTSLSFKIASERLALSEKETGKKSSFSIANCLNNQGVIVQLKIPYLTNYD